MFLRIQYVICVKRRGGEINHSPIKDVEEAQRSCRNVPAPPAFEKKRFVKF